MCNVLRVGDRVVVDPYGARYADAMFYGTVVALRHTTVVVHSEPTDFDPDGEQSEYIYAYVRRATIEPAPDNEATRRQIIAARLRGLIVNPSPRSTFEANDA